MRANNSKIHVKENNISPIAKTYGDIATMLADQSIQKNGYFYEVTDASADANVTTGRATYHYLGTTVGDLTDYHLAFKEEIDVGVSTDNLQKEVINDYNVISADNKYIIVLNKATAFTVTITDPLLDKIECYFYNKGDGVVTFVQGTATNLFTPNGNTLAKDKSAFMFKVEGANEYRIKTEN